MHLQEIKQGFRNGIINSKYYDENLMYKVTYDSFLLRLT